MKSKVLQILIWGILVLGITGCGINNNITKIVKKSNVKIVENKVNLKIKDGTLSNTKATIILENNSNNDLVFGNPYWIEKEQDDKWYILETINDLNFNLPAFILKPNQFKEIEIEWDFGYGKLDSGRYRIVKDISFESDGDNRENFYVAVEFSIK